MSTLARLSVGFAGCCWGAMTLANPAIQSAEQWQEPHTRMAFIQITQGCYRMGNPDALQVDRSDFQLTQLGYQGPRYADEAPVHEVCIDSFWVARDEVTAGQWQQVIGTPPPYGQGQQPASGISWHQAQQFIERLNTLSQAGTVFRLPTEAEWEHACRLGSPIIKPSVRASFADKAWYRLRGTHLQQPNPVGQLQADTLGIKDILGNVWEWTADSYATDGYTQHTYKNPLFENSGQERVIRGGSYRSHWQNVRCNGRGSYPADRGLSHIGLRLVREAVK